jgi:hypothetical protein
MSVETSVERVKLALKQYDEDLSSVADMLADLLHFCEAEDVDFDRALDTARMHHEAERKTT